MKRLFAMILTLALLVCGLAAFAEEGATESDVVCGIEDGSYVIRIPDEDGDLGWVADDMAQDDSVLALASAELVDGEFVVRYDPVGDGDMAVHVKHYIGIACDRMYGFDLHVENGAVTECTDGYFTAAPEEADLDAWLSGEWLEAETQFTQMTIAKNEARGWDVDIIAPMTHGAYEFKATICYDCELNSFVYDKGKYWELPITDSEEEVELGEAAVSGATGSFTVSGEEEEVYLTWVDDRNPEEGVVFCPADAPMAE